MACIAKIHNIRSFRSRGSLAFRGFTLIEMLVVISIILILASLLLPALQKSVNTARNTQCLNNLKQFGMCFWSYTEEFGGFLPWAYISGTANAHWYLRIYRYMDSTLPIPASYSRLDKVGLFCPSATQTTAMFTTYAMNAYAGGINSSTGTEFPSPPYRHLRLGRVTNPSAVYLVGEKEPNTTSSGYALYHWYFPPALNQRSYEYQVGLRHENGSNWLFFDMHAEWRDGFRKWGDQELGKRLNQYY